MSRPALLLVCSLFGAACASEDGFDTEGVAAADPVGALMTLTGGPGNFVGRNCTIAIGRDTAGNGLVFVTDTTRGSGSFVVAAGGDCRVGFNSTQIQCNYISAYGRNNPSDLIAVDEDSFYGWVYDPSAQGQHYGYGKAPPMRASCHGAVRQP